MNTNKEFLAGWSGTLTANGYKPYFNLGNPNIANTACLVHVRRYFAQIVKIAGGDAKAASAASVALEARRRIDAMFKVDSKCVCSIESGPCERVDVFHVSGRFWSTSACGEKRTPARPAWTSFPS